MNAFWNWLNQVTLYTCLSLLIITPMIGYFYPSTVAMLALMALPFALICGMVLARWETPEEADRQGDLRQPRRTWPCRGDVLAGATGLRRRLDAECACRCDSAR